MNVENSDWYKENRSADDGNLHAIMRRDAVVEALYRLDIHDIVTRGIAVMREDDPILDLHVDFETEKFAFWITISQRFDNVVIHRERKGEYERRKFKWEPVTKGSSMVPRHNWIEKVVLDPS